MTAVTLLTQNIWGGFPRWLARRRLLADRIATLRPEIVALQEVHGPGCDGTQSQAHELAALVGGYRVHYAPARDKGSGAAEGVALMFRRDAKSHPPRMLTLDPSDRFEGKNQRVVLAATLEHPEGPVDVLCTHLSLSRVARTRTAKELIDFAHELRGQTKSVAAILLGDLNAEAGEPAVAEIEREWMDAWRTTRGDHRGGTWPALLPFRRLDYVFVQGLANVETCRRIPYSGSDHLGLFARVHLQQRYPVSGPS